VLSDPEKATQNTKQFAKYWSQMGGGFCGGGAPGFPMSISGVRRPTSTTFINDLLGRSVSSGQVPASQVRPAARLSPAAFPRRDPSGFGGARGTHIRGQPGCRSTITSASAEALQRL